MPEECLLLFKGKVELMALEYNSRKTILVVPNISWLGSATRDRHTFSRSAAWLTRDEDR